MTLVHEERKYDLFTFMHNAHSKQTVQQIRIIRQNSDVKQVVTVRYTASYNLTQQGDQSVTSEGCSFPRVNVSR